MTPRPRLAKGPRGSALGPTRLHARGAAAVSALAPSVGGAQVPAIRADPRGMIRKLAVLVFLSGCGASPLASALARVDAACGAADPVPVALVPAQRVRCGGAWDVGCASSEGVRVATAGADDPTLERRLVHELLHRRGAAHIPAGHGIMGRDEGSAVWRISREDLVSTDPVACPRPRAEF